MSASPVLRVAVRSKAFGASEILRGVDVALAPGEVVAITGPSGVGKSTFLRIAAGLDAEFDGAVTGARPTMVFQEPTLLPWRTALANVTIPTGVPDETAALALEVVGLKGRGGDFPGAMSLGQQRRLALARAFVSAPEALLLDEPFVSLDETTSARMLALTAALLDEHRAAAILVTHDLAEAATLADRVIGLEGQPARIAFDTPLNPMRGVRAAADIDRIVGELRGMGRAG